MKRWYLLAILCVNVGCEFPPGISNYEANGQELNADLGFRHDSPYILIDDDPREVFTMSWIQKRKPFAKAGVQRDDIERWQRGYVYLTAIIDWNTRAVLSWNLSNTMDVSFCLEALSEAVEVAGKAPAILGEEQGIQEPPLKLTQVTPTTLNKMRKIKFHTLSVIVILTAFALGASPGNDLKSEIGKVRIVEEPSGLQRRSLTASALRGSNGEKATAILTLWVFDPSDEHVQLLWWISEDPFVRKLIVSLYLCYTTEPTSFIPNFSYDCKRFADVEKKARLDEISYVKKNRQSLAGAYVRCFSQMPAQIQSLESVQLLVKNYDVVAKQD